MEPVSTAIIDGLVAGVASGATKVGEEAAVLAYNAAVAAYNTLKTALHKKFGGNSDVVNAVELLEKKPDSEGQKAVVAEEIKAAKANEDAELITAAEILQAIVDKMQTSQETGKKYYTIAGNIAQVGDNNNHIGDNNYFSSRSGGNK